MTLIPQQMTMFGVPANPEIAFNVYHDESGTYGPGAGDRWLLHGILFVPATKQYEIFTALQNTRQEVGYHEEVHYVKLRQSVVGPKARCAKSWLRTYAGQFSETCFYHCLAIDTHSPGFQHNRFGEPYHAYNYFARVAIIGGIAWSLKRYPRVLLKFHSDDKSRREGDNFASYIPQQVCKRIKEKREKRAGNYPEIRLLHPEVVSVISEPTKVIPEMKHECELIQLVDLMTSNIAQVLTGRSGQKAKIALAEMIAGWIEDTRKPPWLQAKELYRRFSVSCFPDGKGRFYNPILATTNRFQSPLFEDL